MYHTLRDQHSTALIYDGLRPYLKCKIQHTCTVLDDIEKRFL